MALGLLGRKVGMTQIFRETGDVVPVTVLQLGPCKVLQLRNAERDGYEAVQLGFGDKPRRLASRSERGHVAKLDSKRARRRASAGVTPSPKADCEPQRLVREFRAAPGDLSIGQALNVTLFKDVASVNVTGTTRGRGYSGVMRRHNFGGQRTTHGVKKCHRHAGSTGRNTWPARVLKGKKMAGQYGNARCTTRNLTVVSIDEQNNLLVIHGAVPGPVGGYIMVRPTNKL